LELLGIGLIELELFREETSVIKILVIHTPWKNVLIMSLLLYLIVLMSNKFLQLVTKNALETLPIIEMINIKHLLLMDFHLLKILNKIWLLMAL